MRTCLSPVRALIAIVLAIRATNGATVTIYRVSHPVIGTPAPRLSIEEEVSTRVSAIGPGESGMTRYVQEEVVSLFVDHSPFTTVTYISGPTTVTYAFEENASVEYLSSPPALQTGTFGELAFDGIVQNCTLDIGKQTGACVEEIRIPHLVPEGGSTVDSTETRTSTTTYTGALFPVATITTSGASVTSRGVDLVFLVNVIGVLSLFAIL